MVEAVVVRWIMLWKSCCVLIVRALQYDIRVLVKSWVLQAVDVDGVSDKVSEGEQSRCDRILWYIVSWFSCGLQISSWSSGKLWQRMFILGSAYLVPPRLLSC
jgi:hypothetical protein